jgi:hypothetical protein
VHSVPGGSAINHQDHTIELDGKVIGHFSPCQYKAKSGRAHGAKVDANDREFQIGPNTWVERVEAQAPVSGGGYSEFAGATVDMPVGAPPNLDRGQTVGFFPGLESSNTGRTYLAQPVLHYGQSKDGGGAYWSYVGWLQVNDSNGKQSAYFGPRKDVSQGQVVTGIIAIGKTPLIGGMLVKTSLAIVAAGPNGDSMISSNWFSAPNTEPKFDKFYAGAVEATGIDYCNEFPDSGTQHFGIRYLGQWAGSPWQVPVQMSNPGFTSPPIDSQLSPQCGYNVSYPEWWAPPPWNVDLNF